jgi:hypothetical protein
MALRFCARPTAAKKSHYGRSNERLLGTTGLKSDAEEEYPTLSADGRFVSFKG